MKGKLNLYGGLELLRGAGLKKQDCPHNVGDVDRVCGDWCPRLHEPVMIENYFDEQGLWGSSASLGSTKVVLGYCDGELVFDQADFQDERPGAVLKKVTQKVYEEKPCV